MSYADNSNSYVAKAWPFSCIREAGNVWELAVDPLRMRSLNHFGLVGVCVCVSLDSIQYHSGSHPVAISQDTVGRRFVVRIALQNAQHAMCDMFHIRWPEPCCPKSLQRVQHAGTFTRLGWVWRSANHVSSAGRLRRALSVGAAVVWKNDLFRFACQDNVYTPNRVHDFLVSCHAKLQLVT